MYTFDPYFWLDITNTYTTNQSIIFFINQFCKFCVNLLCNDTFILNQLTCPIPNCLLKLRKMSYTSTVPSSCTHNKSSVYVQPSFFIRPLFHCTVISNIRFKILTDLSGISLLFAMVNLCLFKVSKSLKQPKFEF